MLVFKFIFDFMKDIFEKLNEFTVFGDAQHPGVPIGGIFFGFILLSMVISVFWKGARG